MLARGLDQRSCSTPGPVSTGMGDPAAVKLTRIRNYTKIMLLSMNYPLVIRIKKMIF